MWILFSGKTSTNLQQVSKIRTPARYIFIYCQCRKHAILGFLVHFIPDLIQRETMQELLLPICILYVVKMKKNTQGKNEIVNLSGRYFGPRTPIDRF